MSVKPIGVAIVGCGNVAEAYADDLVLHPEIKLIGTNDIELERSERLATLHNCYAYSTLNKLLDDPSVELVINLTTPLAHKEVTEQCLQAGKHVHSEKPLALTYTEAQELVQLALDKGLRLGCSPFTIMGEAQQTAWKWIREGRLGTVRVAYAEANWSRIETRHPAPLPFYEVGALFDVGVYPISILTTIFGPVRQVSAYGTVLYPNRITQAGTPFQINTPDFIVSMLEFESGFLARLSTNFYVSYLSKQSGIEFHGDIGSIHLGSWMNFDASLEFAQFDQPFRTIPLAKKPSKTISWARSVLDMIQAMKENRPHRMRGEQAAHIVEILGAVTESVNSQAPIQVHSNFVPPIPMEWSL